MRAFYAAQIPGVLGWSHEPNAEGLRDGLLCALDEPTSLLRVNLAVDSRELAELRAVIAGAALLSRGIVRTAAAGLSASAKRILVRYTNLVYYCSGARTVNCESAVGQYSFMDYSLGQLTCGAASLSEAEVFWKLIVEQAFDLLGLPPIPIEMVDRLNFSEIAELREPILDSRFAARYDHVVSLALGEVAPTVESLATNTEDLVRFCLELRQQFHAGLQEEMAAFMGREKWKATTKVAGATTALGLGLAGLIPGVGLGFGIAGAALAGRELVTTVHGVQNLAHLRERRATALEEAVKRADLRDKAVLFDVVSYLNHVLTLGALQ